jgi:hypothetical protein
MLSLWIAPHEGLLVALESEAGGPLRRIFLPIADMEVPKSSYETSFGTAFQDARKQTDGSRLALHAAAEEQAT